MWKFEKIPLFLQTNEIENRMEGNRARERVNVNSTIFYSRLEFLFFCFFGKTKSHNYDTLLTHTTRSRTSAKSIQTQNIRFANALKISFENLCASAATRRGDHSRLHVSISIVFTDERCRLISAVFTHLRLHLRPRLFSFSFFFLLHLISL